jgi:transcriptional regulator with XRE-family HTH domain
VPRRNGSTPKGRARRPAPPPPVDVGRVLRVACARKGWSGADLGRALGVSRQRIADVISGRVRPSPAWLERCAVALDISPVELGVPFRVIDLDRPSAELDLVLVDDGPGKPDVLGSPTERGTALLRSLGFARHLAVEGPELVCLVRRATAARVALSLRLDLPPLA